MGTIQPKALLFDVFGTVVDWRSSITDALYSTFQKVSTASSAGSSDGNRAAKMDHAACAKFAQAWRNSYKTFVVNVANGRETLKPIDQHWHDSLLLLLKEWDVEGVLSSSEIDTLSLAWHRLKPWADSSRGLELLNKNFATSTLSNGNAELLNDLASFGNLPFTHITSADEFGSFKPAPEVYLGAAKKLGLKPEECALVATHLNDLEAAKRQGYSAVYVVRDQEEDWGPEKVEEVRKAGWVDLWIEKDEEGFVAAARRLGVEGN